MSIVITKPEVAHSSLRAKVNELLYCLQMDAQRNRTIERLLIEKDNEIQEAYRFSYGVRTLEEGAMGCTSDPYYHVVNIIGIEERYTKSINRQKLRHKRFQNIVDVLPSKDKETFVRAFCTSLEVDEREVKQVIRKHLKTIESYYDLT